MLVPVLSFVRVRGAVEVALPLVLVLLLFLVCSSKLTLNT